METRREVITAEATVLKDGTLETIRHRAIVKEERGEDGELQVFDILLVEDPLGKYTEEGEEIRPNEFVDNR